MSRKKFGGFFDNPASRLKKPKAQAEHEYANNEHEPDTWRDVDIQDSFAVALGTDSKVYTWGDNTHGELGLSTAYNNDKDRHSWVSIHAGWSHYAALRADGTVWAWGNNAYGQFGISDFIHRSSPVQLTSNYSWRKIESGGHMVWGIREDGFLFGWGRNANGELGQNNRTTYSSPVQITIWKWNDIAGGHNHLLGVRDDGTLWSVGYNAQGQLGHGTSTTRSSIIQVGTGTNWASVYAGWSNSFGIQTNGRLYAWGFNTSGQLGDGTVTNQTSPIQIPGSWQFINASYNNTFGKKSDGTLWSWGANAYGELGDPTKAASSSPIQIGQRTANVPNVNSTNVLPPNIVDANPAFQRWLYRQADGTVWSIGRNFAGELAHAADQYSTQATDGLRDLSSPIQIGSDFRLSVTTGLSASMVFAKDDETLWSWGHNVFGELGLNDINIHRSSPVQLNYIENSKDRPNRTLTDQNVKAITAGSSHALAINNDGKLYGWGPRQSIDSKTYSKSWSKVSAGQYHTLAIQSDGSLWAWGDNDNGNLGLNDIVNRSSPVQLPYRQSWVNVKAGLNYSLAIDTEGAMWGWGLGTSGQFYGASGEDWRVYGGKSDPGQVRAQEISPSVTKSWSKVAHGRSFTVAIKSDGTLWGWGASEAGQLGQGNVLGQSSPIQIHTAFSDWADVDAGDQHWAAVRTNGRVWGCGRNTEGQLGQGNAVNYSSPVQITTLGTSNVVATGGYTTFYKRNTGVWYGVGRNTSGELGVSDVISRSAPVVVGASNVYVSVIGAYTTTYFLKSNGTLWGVGLGTSGQLPHFNTTHLGLAAVHMSSPTQVGVGNNTNTWTAMADGNPYSQHFGAIRNGAGFVWGLGTSGQLGQGNVISQSSPVQINSNVVKMTVGEAHTHFIQNQGRLYGVGLNDQGQLGVGNVLPRSTVAQVPGSWTHVTAGAKFTMGRKTDGKLYAWGDNTTYGMLGNSNVLDASSPVQIGTYNIQDIDCGIQHTLMVTTDGKLWAWGRNDYGQLGVLGQGHVVSYSEPVQIYAAPQATMFTELNGGLDFTLGKDSANVLWGWGLGTNGRLGQGNALSQSSPVQIATDIAVGEHKFAASRLTTHYITANGALWGVGGNNHGQLANGVVANVSHPVQIGLESWTQVASQATSSHVVALRSDGTLWTWGRNNYGQLGDGTVASRSSPIQVGADSDWVWVDAGQEHSFAKKSDGTLYGWGRNELGNLGLNDAIHRSSPTLTSISFTQMVTGAHHSHALAADGTLWAWGYNNVSRLGDSTTANKSSPVQIGDYTDWTAIAAGGNYSMAVRDNGKLFAWGGGASGQLGQRNTANFNSPVLVYAKNRVHGETKSWTLSTKLGDTHAFAFDETGEPWVWGLGTSGQLGNPGQGIITHVSSPTQIGLRESWIAVGAGQLHSTAITANGMLYAWGRGYAGATAIGPVVGQAATVSEPVQIGSNEDRNESWSDIGTGQYTSYAIRNDGALFAWGWNDNGQLGLKVTGATNSQNRSSPVQIGYSESWSMVRGNYLFAGAIKADGTLWMWGYNASGQLGQNNTTARNSPVQVAGSWSMISLGRSHTVGIQSDGTLWGWGQNTYGQLGDNSVTQRNSPIQISADTDWNYVSSGNWAVQAIKSDGSMWGWGRGTRNGIGTANLSSPVQIKAGWSFSQVSAGSDYSLAIRDNGELYAWGLGASGKLGNGFINDRASPIQIGFDTNWTYISAGYNTAYGIRGGKLYSWGDNTNGILGNGNVAPATSSSPVQVGMKYFSDPSSFRGGDTGHEYHNFSWVQVSAHQHSVLARTADGKLYAWGRNAEGQLAYCRGDNLDRSSPVQISAESWTLVKASRSGTVALRSNGDIFNWGLGSTGENGNNLALSQSSPVLARARQYSIGCDNHTSWSSIEAGGYSKYAIDPNGILHAWGINTQGQNALPLRGISVSHSSPVQIAIGKSFTQVRSGQNFALGLTTEGTIWTWGQNAQGQLGHANVILLSSPVQLGNKSAWLGVGTARYVGYATEANTLYTWGIGNQGILGLGERTYVVPEALGTPSRSSPIQIATRNTGIVPWGTTENTKSGGGFSEHIAVLDSEGSLFSWGRNSHNQTGQPANAFMISRSSPVQLANYQRYHSDGKPYKKSWIQIAAGTTSAFGLTHDGLLFGWGNNAWGQFSILWSEYVSGSAGINTGQRINTSSPVQIGLFDNNSNPQISDPSNPDTQFRSNSENLSWAEIAASSSTLHAIRADGTLWQCGLNNYGQYGDGGRTARSSIVQLGSDSNYVHVSAENSTMGFIKTDGTLWMTGYNGQGGLGDGTVINRSTIVQVGSDTDWYDLSVGWQHTIAQKTDSTLWGWGRNDTSGGTGLGDSTTANKSSPIQLNSGLAYYKNPNRGTGMTFSAGTYFTVAIRGDEYGSNNLLYVWGRNNEGQMGTGNVARVSSPIQLGAIEMTGEKTLNNHNWVNYPTKIGDLNYTDVAAADNFTVAISSDKMYSWGNNEIGQLGNPNANTEQVEYYSPVLIPTTEDFREVVVAYDKGIAVKK